MTGSYIHDWRNMRRELLEEATESRIQDETRQAVSTFQDIASEAKREQLINLTQIRIWRRSHQARLLLRHDFVITGRAAAPMLDCLGRPSGTAPRSYQSKCQQISEGRRDRAHRQTSGQINCRYLGFFRLGTRARNVHRWSSAARLISPSERLAQRIYTSI
jgi:hypothetical protein